MKTRWVILIDDILNTGKTFSEAAKIVEREERSYWNLCCFKPWFICEGAVQLLDQAPIKGNLSNSLLLKMGANAKILYTTLRHEIATAKLVVFHRIDFFERKKTLY